MLQAPSYENYLKSVKEFVEKAKRNLKKNFL